MADEKPYDSAFKTIAERNRELLVPMVNEFFGRHYPEGTKVELLRDEHHVRKGKQAGWPVLDTDALFRIGEMLYHIECQSTPDGIIAIRMVEYGFHIAIDGARRSQDGAWELRMPLAAVLYLRYNSRTPEAERARLEAMRPGKLGYAAEHVAEFVDYVSRHLLEGYEQTSQEVSSVMGGKLIETKAYKAYLEGQADGEAKGEARGEARGEAKLSKLIAHLFEIGKSDQILSVTQDALLRNQLYEKYSIV